MVLATPHTMQTKKNTTTDRIMEAPPSVLESILAQGKNVLMASNTRNSRFIKPIKR
jgi:hypothetical protein